MTSLWEEFEQISAKYCQHITLNNFNTITHISLKYNYLYISNPKVACSTIKRTLQKLELNDPEFENVHDRDFSPLLRPSQVKNLERFIQRQQPFTFTFVRNPYTRLLSAYIDKIQGRTGILTKLLDFIQQKYGETYTDLSFSDFIDVVCEQKPRQMDPHWRIQYFHTLQEQLTYDFIGKFENFEQDFKQILNTIAAPSTNSIASFKLHATHANQILSQYYTPSLIDKVKAKFAPDFEHFNYDAEAIAL